MLRVSDTWRLAENAGWDEVHRRCRRLSSPTVVSSKDRLIFALDVPTKEEALRWVERLGDAVTFYKLGLEFCMSGSYFEVIEELQARGKKIFADLKLSDIPATVRGAVSNLATAWGDVSDAARHERVYREVVPVKGEMKLLAVTVLTSVGADDAAEMGWHGSIEDLVSLRARKSCRSRDRRVDLLPSGNGAAAAGTRSRAGDCHAGHSGGGGGGRRRSKTDTDFA